MSKSMAKYAQKILFFFCRKCGLPREDAPALQGAEAALADRMMPKFQ
jgi:hypothetical protein